jgi:hypothetical protein
MVIPHKKANNHYNHGFDQVNFCLSMPQNSSPSNQRCKVNKAYSALPRVDIAASADLGTTASPVALAGQDTRQVVFVHEITLAALAALLFRVGTDKLLLVLGKDELLAPSSLTTATLPLAVCAASNGLGHAVYITAVVPLHVLLQVHGECAIGGGRAGNTSEGILATARAELLVHFLGGQEASVTTLDKGSQMLDLLESRGRQKVEVHLQKNVLTL